MGTKFLSRLSDKEIFELFKKTLREDVWDVTFEKNERQDDGFKLYVWSAGDLLPFYCNDFDVIENACFFSNTNYDLCRAWLYKKFGMEYAKAYFEYLEKVYVL